MNETNEAVSATEATTSSSVVEKVIETKKIDIASEDLVDENRLQLLGLYINFNNLLFLMFL